MVNETKVSKQQAFPGLNKDTTNKSVAVRRTTGVHLVDKIKKGDSGRTTKIFDSIALSKDDYKSGNGFGVGFTTVIEPPYSMEELIAYPFVISTLKQCIQAKVTNTVLNGYTLEPKYNATKEDLKLNPEAEEERSMLECFLENVNEDQTITELLEQHQLDYETTGNAYVEKVRDRYGRPAALYHVPAQTVKLTWEEDDPTIIQVEITKSKNGKQYVKKIPKKKYFRRLVQQNVLGKNIYFKEHLDHRAINSKTGAVIPEEDLKAYKKETATKRLEHKTIDLAHELLHRKPYSPNSTYGLPDYINEINSLLGLREAELTNLDYFESNAIPALAILVSGGYLTADTMENLENILSNIKGRESQNKVLLMEAMQDKDDLFTEDGKSTTPTLKIETLGGERQDDALFKEYIASSKTNLRASFRLPKVFLGEDTDDSSAQAALTVAEDQVFTPEKNKIEDFVNTKILNGFNLKYWKFRLKPAKFISKEDRVNAFTALTASGALSANRIIDLYNDLLDLDIHHIEEVWANYPIKIVLLYANQGRLKGVESFVQFTEESGIPLPLSNSDNKPDIRDNDNNIGSTGETELDITPTNTPEGEPTL